MSDVKMLGDYGCYIDESNVISFQVGDNPRTGMDDPGFSVGDYNPLPDMQWQSINGYQVCSRGYNNMKCEEVAADLKKNRLLPRLITKQANMLYGKGPAVYQTVFADGKFKREWVECPEIMNWLDSWKDRGLESDYKEVAKALIKDFYYFRDYFVKWRFSVGRNLGALPVAGIETMENRNCRLATTKRMSLPTWCTIVISALSLLDVGTMGYPTSRFTRNLTWQKLPIISMLPSRITGRSQSMSSMV